jgi:hypothetical protein
LNSAKNFSSDTKVRFKTTGYHERFFEMQRKRSIGEKYHAYRAIEAKVKVRKKYDWERVFHLVEALIKDIRIITLHGVDDGGEERELDKIMSVMVLAKIDVK